MTPEIVVYSAIPGPSEQQCLAGEHLKVSNLGLMLFRSPVYSGVSLGYTSESIYSIEDNTLLLFDEYGNPIASQ